MTKRKMKDSGVAWIGQVPEGWSVERLQWHIDEVNDKNNPIRYTNVLSLTNDRGVIPYEDKGAQGNKSKDNLAEYKIAYKNCIVANSMNILIGSVGLSGYDGCVSPVYYVFRAKTGTDIGYLNYLFQLSQFQRELRRFANGILEIRLRVSSADIVKRTLAFPKESEQRKIAAFLDGECGKIDVLRGKVEKQIAALEEYRKSVITEAVTKGIKRGRKMKVADVAWIATAPQEWERTRLKLLCDRDITYGIVKLGDPDEDGIKVLRCSDVLAGRIAEGEIRTVTKSLSQEYSRTILRGGEVVVNVRGTLGGCAVVPEKMRGYNIAREVAMVAVKGNAADARFIMYQLLSSSFDSYIKMQLSGAVYVGLNIEMLGKYSFFCPDLSEQHEIAAYLDKKCAAIDSMVAKCREELERLAEYKKSLIYEYVTGKKEVA